MAKKTLVITGLNGSGKSVLLKILGLHPEIELTEEFGCFRQLDISYCRHLARVRKNFLDYPLVGLTETSKKRRFLKNMLFLTQYSLALDPYRFRPVTLDVVESALHRIFRHASVVGDVSPGYDLNQLNKLPSVYSVVVYRDCRDLAATIALKFAKQLKQPEKYPWIKKRNSPKKVAQLWVSWMNLMEHYADKVYPIRYEDLVHNPQETLAQFGKWLRVDSQKFTCQTIHTNDVGIHKQYLSERDTTKIRAIAGPMLEQFGYI